MSAVRDSAVSNGGGAYLSPNERRESHRRSNNYDAISPFLQHSQEAESQEYDQKNQMWFRVAFSVIFVGCLMTTMFQTDRGQSVLKPDECLRDYTFIWTDSINQYLAANRDVTDRYIIYCSFMMDFMLLNFFAWWLFYWKSFRMIITYLLFFGIRGVIQVSNLSLSCLAYYKIIF